MTVIVIPIMPIIDRLFSIQPLRKAIWKLWYPFLTRRLRKDDVLFLNYAFETEPPMVLQLSPEDEPNRPSIQLYHHVATQAVLKGKRVLEVSCGHGGGASYLSRTLHPASYTGLDLNGTGVRFCQKRHARAGLTFLQGDAEHLPFPSGSFGAVINVEASHCYPDFPQFLREVERVLQPGGTFLYADFRFRDGFESWERDLANSPLSLFRQSDISADVLRGMDLNSARSLDLIHRTLPPFLQGLGRDFAGVEGSRLYEGLKCGEVSYRSFCFTKMS